MESNRIRGFNPKDRFKFDVAVVDIHGRPISKADVTVDLLQRKVYSHRKRLVGGFYAYDHAEEVKPSGSLCAGQTNPQGLLICEVKSPLSGNVILQAKTVDREGRTATVYQDIWVAGKDEWWFDLDDNDRMDLLPERKQYEPGETAHFQVRMPFRSATALVTVEREGIVRAFVTTLTGKNPVVSVPIKDTDAPNIFVSVLVVRGRVGGIAPTGLVDLGRPAYKLGIAEINVGWKGHALKVHLATDRKVYKVRESVRLKISARTAYGKLPPPGSEVAVAAVDEGLLELSPNTSWEILPAMMGRRGMEVDTATAQMHVIGKRHFGLKAIPPGGGGGRQMTRELFDTLLLWKGRVRLNSNGEAEIPIPLNDSITGFRIAVVATGGMNFFGTGETSIQTTQELMLLPGIAPLVREGDRFRSEFTLRNTTNRHMETVVSGYLLTPDYPSTPLTTKTFQLAPGTSQIVGWDQVAPLGVDRLTYDIVAQEKGSGHRDLIKVSQKVIPAIPIRTFQATLTQLDRTLTMPVSLPQEALAGRGGIHLTLRRSLADGMKGVTDYMKQYPYNCMEQKVSRAVALQDLALWDKAMSVLPTYLDADGRVKYFPSMIFGSSSLTAYLISIADEAGWEIPKDARGKMVEALRHFVEGKIIEDTALPTADLIIRKIAAIEALSRVSPRDTNLLDAIRFEPNLWPTSTLIDLLNIRMRSEGLAHHVFQIKEVSQILRSRLNFQGTTLGFSTEDEDRLWWLMTSPDGNAVRLILAVLDQPEWQEDLPRLMRGGLARQHRGHWDLTTTNAWGVLATKKFSARFEKTPVTGTTRGTVGTQVKSFDWPVTRTLEAQTRSEAPLIFPWPSGVADMIIDHQGQGKPWATLQSLAAIPLKIPLSSGYTLTRQITPLEPRQEGQITQGDRVKITLKFTAQADMTWVVLDDPIPGGATILGSHLGGGSKGSELDPDLPSESEEWSQAWPTFQEHSFESFRAYFEYLPKGKWTIEYIVRLNNAGMFQRSPTRIEAMYAPEMFGELPHPNITVHPRPEKSSPPGGS